MRKKAVLRSYLGPQLVQLLLVTTSFFAIFRSVFASNGKRALISSAVSIRHSDMNSISFFFNVSFTNTSISISSLEIEWRVGLTLLLWVVLSKQFLLMNF